MDSKENYNRVVNANLEIKNTCLDAENARLDSVIGSLEEEIIALKEDIKVLKDHSDCPCNCHNPEVRENMDLVEHDNCGQCAKELLEEAETLHRAEIVLLENKYIKDQK